MEVITHTIFAAVCMGACYFWGRYLSKDEILEGVVGTMLDRLEKDGFIRTVEGEDGDMELVPISEIIEENRQKVLDNIIPVCNNACMMRKGDYTL